MTTNMQVVDLGRCQFLPEPEAQLDPQFEIVSAKLRLAEQDRLEQFESESVPQALVFKISGGFAVPADQTTRETFSALARAINGYLVKHGPTLIESAQALLRRERIGPPFRVSADGKLSSAHVTAVSAIAADASTRLNQSINVPKDLRQLAQSARGVTAAIQQLTSATAAGSVDPKSPGTVQASDTRRKNRRRGIVVAVGGAAIGIGVIALLSRG